LNEIRALSTVATIIIIVAVVIIAGFIILNQISPRFLGSSGPVTVTCSGNGCPFYHAYEVDINYNGSWSLSYQVYNGLNVISGILEDSGNFTGRGSTNQSVSVLMDDANGMTTCFEAQKLQNSDSPLVLSLPQSNSEDQTSVPFGAAEVCVLYPEQTGITTTSYPICTYPGQSMGLDLTVLSDSTLVPVTGANVFAFYNFNEGCNSTIAQTSTKLTFTTNGTEWYSLYGLNNGNYTISVLYSHTTYAFIVQLRPSVYTCAVLFVPSGNTSITFTSATCQIPSSKN
jgi:hypothetical protein